MDTKKRNVVVSLLSAVLVSIWFYDQYDLVDKTDAVQIGQFLLKAIGLGILFSITAAIVTTVFVAIVWGGLEKSVFDERDKLIELYVMRVILVVFSIGFVITLGLVGWYSLSMNMAMIVLFICMYGANVLGELVKYYWYR